MKSATLLKDTAELRPLYDFLFRFYHYLPVGNFIAETVVKTVKRTLHPTQRRKEETQLALDLCAASRQGSTSTAD